jgi:hypothetical protein
MREPRVVPLESIALRACSACAGDYEDPDRLVWTDANEEEVEGEDAFETVHNEFPVPEN